MMESYHFYRSTIVLETCEKKMTLLFRDVISMY